MSLLGAGGLTKVGQLLEMGDAELLAVKGFGPKALEEVREAVRAFVERAPAAAPAEVVEPLGLEAVPEVIGEASAEPAAVVEGVVPEEEEAEVVLYEAPPEQVEKEGKPQIRFKEDIFGDTVRAGAGVGKRGKKKKSREDRQEQEKQKKAKKVRPVAQVDEEFDYSE